MIEWPTSLVREIAARRVILFLGAGVSASAMAEDGSRTKTWDEFISEAIGLVRVGPDRQAAQRLVEQRRLLLALQLIRDKADVSDYRAMIDREFNNQKFKAGELHKRIFKLDSKIVITTNFDKLYERYCIEVADNESFKVITYESSDFADELRSDTRLIVKAHGTVDSVSKMIFTRAEYHRAKAEHSNFYEMLKAVFLTHTVVFIGCGMSDPDVSLLLEDVKIIGNSQSTHYALVKAGSTEPAVAADWAATYNVKCLEYGPDHADLVADLDALVEQVNLRRQTTS
jgi:hypothetical protein